MWWLKLLSGLLGVYALFTAYVSGWYRRDADPRDGELGILSILSMAAALIAAWLA